jgi:hypothetical protein
MKTIIHSLNPKVKISFDLGYRWLLKSLSLVLVFHIILISYIGAQEAEEAVVDRPVRATFESAIFIDNQTVMVPIKGTLEFDMQHRFGTVGKGYEDLYGLYSNSNIRLGFSYVPIENLSVGFGLTKFKHLIDLNIKYSLLRQTRSGKIPLSVTYFGNMAIDTRKEDRREEVFQNSDRLSFFHQIIIARRFTNWLSFQVAPSLSHYNMISKTMENDHFAIAFATQLKLTDAMSFIIGVDQPITQHSRNNPNPNISFGVQFATSSHAFQIFMGNYNSILPQENNVFNTRNYSDGFGDNFLIGFNITRLSNF